MKTTPSVFKKFIFTVVFAACFTFFSQARAESKFYLDHNEKIVLIAALKIKNLPVDQRNLQAKKFIDAYNQFPSKATETKLIKTFNEFLEENNQNKFFLDKSFESLSIEELIARIKKVSFYSNHSGVQRKIDDYLENRKNKLAEFGFSMGMLLGEIASSSEELDRKNLAKLQLAINDFTQKKVNGIFDEIKKNPTQETEVLSKLLKSYFKYLPDKQKSEMLYQVLQLPINAKMDDLFLIFIQNCGPQLQKLIQIIGRSPDFPEQYKSLFEKLESQVKPVPWAEVKKILLKEGVDLSKFTYFEHKPIGVGTMAQTHRVHYLENGIKKSAVIRFLKPHIETLLEMDHEILTNTAKEIDSDESLKKYKMPSLLNLIDDLHKTVVEELYIQETAANQEKGRKTYQDSRIIKFSNQKNLVELTVPGVELIGKNKNVMLQELIFGKKPTKLLTEYKEVYPELYQKIAEFIAESWIQHGFFGSGFFHADLHQGNMLIQLTDEKINVNLLDFGMTGQLSKKLQESVLLLALAVKLDHTDLLVKHFQRLSKNNTLPEHFYEKAKQRMKYSQANDDYSVMAWTAWAMDQGLELNYEFLKLNRGLKAIEMLLQDSGSKLEIEDIAINLLKSKKSLVTKILISENLLRKKEYIDLFKLGIELINPANNKSIANRCESLFTKN